MNKPWNDQEGRCSHDDYRETGVVHHSKNRYRIFASIPFSKLHMNFDSMESNLFHPFYLDHDSMGNNIQCQWSPLSIVDNRDSLSELQLFSMVTVPSRENSLFLLDTRNRNAILILSDL